jgi:hypothetical protein
MPLAQITSCAVGLGGGFLEVVEGIGKIDLNYL